jgi:acyl dehydratase
MPQITIHADQLKDWVGKELPKSKAVQITQEKIQKFAESTGDFQWIHVDVERAKKESPYGGPIAHGYLTLSLVPDLSWNIIEITGYKTVINYGINKLRFIAPVPSGSYVYMTTKIKEIKEIPKGVQCIYDCSIFVEGAEKPAMIAEIVFLLMDKEQN